MIVKPQLRKIALRLRDPLRVLNILPQSKMVAHKGRSYVVVPYELDVVRVLRNLGINPPSPIEHYYSWPIRPGWKPMAHQIETAGFLSEHRRAYCLNDLGTAKTLSALWAFDFLRKENEASRLLVISPLSTVDRVWGDELFMHFPHLTFQVLHGTKAKRIQLLNTDPDVSIINHDGVKTISKHLIRANFDAIIIDEISQAARNAQSDRWKAMNSVVQGRKFVWGMTGTPIPNSPMDAWAQCRMLTPHTVPAYASHFRSKVMRQITTFKWVPQPDALDTVYAAMQPSIRFKRDDVIDLPPIMYEDRECELSTEQRIAYKDMWDRSYTECKDGSVSAANEGVRVTKLVQICCGVAIGDDSRVMFPPKSRLRNLLATVEEADAKVIVFVPYRAPLELIAHVLGKRYSIEVIHGGVAKGARDKIFSRFQKEHDPRVLVAQPAAMSHGLTLTEANVIVWFAPPNNAEIYQQANGRITRPGQKRNQLIIHLQGTALERQMYKRLRDKTNMQGVLLDMFS